ncbi:MoaD/ThiS family protein [Alicyclobacillus fastidiosus]|uniref:Molybdopterin synthase sulfur carrier subunit n=1 Tax=Alicyclobacillus fastidiosus TaxID=392011 RepID=A0ABY6ZCR0_9BACL|nr:MoaD/ThiS family protein [Alicyclobacillus fastidiosus]WAH40680.1 MoaD/ThiS family protein [Alicyclobacillus fastidiosus]GMA62145.1 hypothetical protein GCM10025859_25850 [Alicyclobacillus fastidiosus]
MQLYVRLFANLREAAGANELVLDLDGDVSADELLVYIRQKYPALTPLLTNAMVARNRTICSPSQRLTATDDIALIPPVGGG